MDTIQQAAGAVEGDVAAVQTADATSGAVAAAVVGATEVGGIAAQVIDSAAAGVTEAANAAPGAIDDANLSAVEQLGGQTFSLGHCGGRQLLDDRIGSLRLENELRRNWLSWPKRDVGIYGTQF